MVSRMLGLRTTIYRVSDVDAAKAWYAKAFDTQPNFDNGFYVGFSVGGYELGLMKDETPAASKATSVVSYWGVEDVDGAVAHLTDLGAKVLEEPANVGGEIVVAAVTDPWGNAVGVIYNPEFSATS